MAHGWTSEDLNALQRRRQTAQAPRGEAIAPAKVSKHRSRKCVLGGLTFDSEKELRRWQELLLLEQVGAIRNLRRQVSFDLWACNGERIARYVADAVYWSLEFNREVREDTKSDWTRRLPVYRMKFKLMRAQGTPITEV